FFVAIERVTTTATLVEQFFSRGSGLRLSPFQRHAAQQQEDPNEQSRSRSPHSSAPATGAASGESTTARLWRFVVALTSVIPSSVRSFSSGTFIGPGAFAVPGAGCGNAVDIAV